MKIKVKFFALYRQITGKEQITLQVSPNISVSQLLEKLQKDFPVFNGKSFKPLVAVNEEYAGPDRVLKNGDLVAILPPFSGGET